MWPAKQQKWHFGLNVLFFFSFNFTNVKDKLKVSKFEQMIILHVPLDRAIQQQVLYLYLYNDKDSRLILLVTDPITAQFFVFFFFQWKSTRVSCNEIGVYYICSVTVLGWLPVISSLWYRHTNPTCRFGQHYTLVTLVFPACISESIGIIKRSL